jgi:hypothetical protein
MLQIKEIKKNEMKKILEKLKQHMLFIDHSDDSFKIIERLQNLKKPDSLSSVFESKEMEVKNDEKEIDVAKNGKECHMLTGSLLHRQKYLKTMSISWSMPKLYENAFNHLPSEVCYKVHKINTLNL